MGKLAIGEVFPLMKPKHYELCLNSEVVKVAVLKPDDLKRLLREARYERNGA